MSDISARQTSYFMEGNQENYRRAMQPDATSGGRLLSASEESGGVPAIKMSRAAKRRVRIVLIVILLVILAAIVAIVAILATGRPAGSPVDELQHPQSVLVSHKHVRCKYDVIVSDEASHWRHFNDRMPEWKQLPDLRHGGYVIISPGLKLEKGYPGVLVSLQLPGNNTRFHVVAATTNMTSKAKARILHSGHGKCESVAIDDADFFSGEERVFRLYVFYKSLLRLHGIKATVTALPRVYSYKAIKVGDDIEMTNGTDFFVVKPGGRDHCSLEVFNRSEIDCNWRNIEGEDAADFMLTDGSDCIARGTKSDQSAINFLKLETDSNRYETRALLISPLLRQDAPTVTFTLWFKLKCPGLEIRVHRVAGGESNRRVAMGTSTVIARISSSPTHGQWEFRSFDIPLPGSHASYQLVVEGIIPANASCSGERCNPTVAIDSLTLELFYERCESSDGSDVMDCSFQTDSSKQTMCEWKSSYPEQVAAAHPPGTDLDDYAYGDRDWKSHSSGMGTDHGATAQHMEGRGRTLSYEPAGNAGREPYLRTPLLIATKDCSCLMNLTYLMRGPKIPRLQVNMIYGDDITDEYREKEPQWSLYGHQSDDWETAMIAINLNQGASFQIEIRSRNVKHGEANIHIDDVVFERCAMKKH